MSPKKLQWILVFILGLFCCCEVFAQDPIEVVINDPLKKPDLWAKLKETPADMKLWTQYFGKEWDAMTKAEQEKVSIWRQELMLKSIFEKEVVITSEEKAVEADKEIIEDLKSSELRNAEALIMQEQEEITELKGNIAENFVILEDLYREIFKEYGMEYKSYKETHPDSAFPISKWVEEQDAKIVQLKKAKLDQLRSQIKKN